MLTLLGCTQEHCALVDQDAEQLRRALLDRQRDAAHLGEAMMWLIGCE
ncbi:hypothetical protein [Bradyrhizobium sp. CCGB20]|nr:hypothetical protein [Bradyrhizobium sp. CCGB20]MCP3399169.1 hypothetical protein [Bradyrhizobium sp. CCGB20]